MSRNSVHPGGAYAVMGDGSVRFVRSGVSRARSRLFSFQLDVVVDGVSPIGINQLVRAEIITGSGDRRALANAILRKMGFTALIDTKESEKLMPAVQGLRDVLARGSRKGGISAIGAFQFLDADPVSSPQDREVLSGKECLVLFLGGMQSAFDPNFQGGIFVASR